MFDIYCVREGARTLLGPRQITSLHNTSEGIVVYFRCRCGQPGVVVWGRGAPSAGGARDAANVEPELITSA